MLLKSTFTGLVTALILAGSAHADGIEIIDPYARASGMSAMAGAAFMVIRNSGDTDDRLIGAASDVAQRVELHTHTEEDGVMRMVEVEEGFVLPAGGEILMVRGSHHVMFMGLNDPFEQDRILSVTLIFEQAGEIVVDIPVDLERMPGMEMAPAAQDQTNGG